MIPLTVPHRNKEIVFADVFVLFCCLSFSLPRPSPFLFYSLLFGVIHFICVLKASRHLFGHHFPFLLADELPPPWYGYRAIYFTPTRPVWDCRPLYTTHIYKYTRVLLSQYYLSVSHTGLRLWEIHNGLASIYNIYRSPASYIATDIFFFLSLFSFSLFIIISAKQALLLLIVENDEWISDFDLLFLDPGGASACVCVCSTQRPMRSFDFTTIYNRFNAETKKEKRNRIKKKDESAVRSVHVCLRRHV